MTPAATGLDMQAQAEAEQLIALLEEENTALAGMQVASVVASVGRKRALVEKIAARATTRGGKPPIDASCGRRLAAASRRNAALLDAAIFGQRELMKILASAVRGAEERKVYVRHGHATQLTRSVGLTIATSA